MPDASIRRRMKMNASAPRASSTSMPATISAVTRGDMPARFD